MPKPQETTTKTRAKDSIKLARIARWIFLVVGAIALIASFVYVSSMLAFMGLGLLFWGAIFFYIQTEEYTKKALLEASLSPLFVGLARIIQELDYRGRTVYLPPRYFKDEQDNKIFIPKQKDAKLPTKEQIMKHETQVFIKEPQGILLTSPGAELTKLFEKTLDTDFARTDLRYLEEKMPKLFIEELEIAENFEMERSNGRVLGKIVTDKIRVRVTNSVYKDIDKEIRKLSYIHEAIGCPISSAIACALAKATGKPLVIEKDQTSEDGQTIDIQYRLLEEPKEETQ